MLLGLLMLPLVRFSRYFHYGLYPLTLFFLSQSWLVEPRYFLLPFMFFLLLRQRVSPIVEHALVLFFAAGSVVVFYGTMQLQFFA